MSATYDGSLKQKKDQVRFLVLDTTNLTTDALVQDEEIEWVLTEKANVFRAAALICDRLTVRLRGMKRKRVGDTDIEFGSAEYGVLAGRLRAHAALGDKPFAGGISISEKQILEDDTDWPDRDFYRGVHDHQEADDRTAAVEKRNQ